MRTKAEEHFMKLISDKRIDIFTTKEKPYIVVYRENL